MGDCEMSNLQFRLERLERQKTRRGGGLYWVTRIPKPDPLPESYSVGGLTFLYMRPDEAKAFCEAARESQANKAHLME
jgi:hypothetical protein